MFLALATFVDWSKIQSMKQGMEAVSQHECLRQCCSAVCERRERRRLIVRESAGGEARGGEDLPPSISLSDGDFAVGSTIRPTRPDPAEREAIANSVMGLYNPPARLRKKDKDLLKRVWSIQQGYLGSQLKCPGCNTLGSLGQISIHHKDGILSHNDPDNLEPACFECNRNEGAIVRRRVKAQVTQSEREQSRGPPSLPHVFIPNESESLQRHKKQRMGFNLWLYHPKNGLAGQGALFSRRGIAMKAVDVVGMGSWKTYASYVDEDVVGGYWEQGPEGDVADILERTGKPFPLERLGMRTPDQEERNGPPKRRTDEPPDHVKEVV